MELLLEHVGKGIIVMLMMAMPLVLTAASVGLVVGILQAVTQVQEQTIAAAPKIFGVFLMLMILGGFSMNTISKYFMEASDIAFNIIPNDEEMVLPPLRMHYGHSTLYGEKFYGEKKPKIEEAIRNPGKLPLHDKKYKESFIKTPGNVTYPPDFLEKGQILNGK